MAKLSNMLYMIDLLNTGNIYTINKNAIETIASQFIIYYIGKLMNIDVSKPKYSENAMKIYFYKGDL